MLHAHPHSTAVPPAKTSPLSLISVMEVLGLLSLLILGITLSSSWSTGPPALLSSSATPEASQSRVESPHLESARTARRVASGSVSADARLPEAESGELVTLDAEGAAAAASASSGVRLVQRTREQAAAVTSKGEERGNRASKTEGGGGGGGGREERESAENTRQPREQESVRRMSGRSAFLRREMLRNTSVTCNDGTTAGYYVRVNPSSRRWLVFLEGGWHCFSQLSCHQRWTRARALMTSAHWPLMRSSESSPLLSSSSLIS